MGGRGRAGLLLSSSVAALLIGGGAPAALAAGCTVDQTGGTVASVINSSATANCINVKNATVTGDVVNTSTGVLTANGGAAPSSTGITINNSRIGGAVSNIGTINATKTGINVGNNSIVTNGIVNQGLIQASRAGIVVDSVPTFGGGILNSGTIVGGSTGIAVAHVGTFSGGISNSGTISAFVGIDVCNCVTTFLGGITNSGLIAASSAGIKVLVSTFGGAISNSGTITVGGVGIFVSGASVFGTPTAGGGIVNSGTIGASAAAIVVTSVSHFLGGITNQGLLVGGAGIVVGLTPFSAVGVSVFQGGVVNQGTILAAGAGFFNTGIAVLGVSTFTGGIANSGTISQLGSSGVGISVSQVDTFSGGITNSGTIAGFAVGIDVCGCVNTFGGGITNSGLIAVSGTGITVASASTFGGGITNSGTITSTGLGFFGGVGISVSNVSAFSGDIVNRGSIIVDNSGVGIKIDGVTTFAGAIANSGTISAGLAGIQLTGGIGSFGGGISNGGLITLTNLFSGAGITIDNVSLFTGGVHNSGTISAGTGIAVGLACGCGVSTFSGGITNTGSISAQVGILVGNVATFDGHIVNTGTISGVNAAINLSNASVAITIDQNGGMLAGDILLSPNGDTLNVRGGTINGNIIGQNAGETINFSLGAGTFTYAAAYGFSNINQVNVNSGVVILDGANQATNVSVLGGVLQVGDAASTTATLTSTVDVIGGTLSGHGTIAGDVTIENGGILFPGGSIGTLTITNSLTFNPGSVYLVQIAPGAGNNSATLVTGGAGIATINGGTVSVLPQLGHYGATTYTIVTATNGVTGTFSSATPTFVGPFAFTGSATLSYDANDVFLNLSDGFALLAPLGTNQNQQAVVNGINAFILGSGANPPPQFANLANLPGPALLDALSQLSGENSAGFLQGAFHSGDLFLTLMVNPFLDGRFGPGGGFAAAMGFAAEQPPAMPEAALAFAKAMPTKAPPLGIATSASAAYRVWGSAYGGAETVDGNAVVGSQRTTSRAFGFAAGVDYPIAPMTTVGFALAGGGTNWGLDGGLGSGHSDVFQAGLHGSHRWGAAYVSGALSYNFHDVTTDRTVTVAGVDRLTAGFQAHGIGARIEGGYHYATPWLGITPYGAVQVQSIFLPAYGETATAGSNQFALNFASQAATTTRTELGAWFDKSTLLSNGALLTLYGRAAWAHDFGNTRAVSAIFQALPGSNFVVNGATPAPDSALITAGALYRLMNGWSFQAKLDAEFSSTTNVYSGTGVVKKVW